jgi:glutamate/tyrosine decarboxylase-like PLP-dependent enzyme
MVGGVREDHLVFLSAQSHYCRYNVTGWLGLGEHCLVEIPSGLDNDMRIDLLEEALRRALREGRKIAAIVATLGTTDAFGLDDLEAIVAIRDRLADEFSLPCKPHVHADAVIGWAWSVFNDYDFDQNPLGFRPRTLRALHGARRRISALHLADSIGIDFHKTCYAPYISSLFLARERANLELLARRREKMPYLFQSGELHPGLFTLETSRSACGVLAALGNLLLFGKDGLRALLGHVVEMAEVLRENLEGNAYTTVLNGGNVGAVTLFRAYPDGIDTWTVKDHERADPSWRERLLAHNDYNRRIFRYLHDEAMRGEGVLLSMTDCYRHTDYGEPIAALKSYILSPFVEEQHLELIVAKVLEARERVGGKG